jgi:hypothetical protein
MYNFLTAYPDESALLRMNPGGAIPEVNGHVHTPYSFSAFDSIGMIFEMALREKVAAVGINDFFVADGYNAFCTEALKRNVFPMFNIEFICLMKQEQQAGIRINDPNNPGRCYFSGKGLDYPFYLPENMALRLQHVVAESQEQVMQMVRKCNDWLDEIGAGFRLDYDDIRKKYAMELVRERHIATALRVKVAESGDEPKQRALLQKIYGGREPLAAVDNIPETENEIRGNLLKAGGKAFVPEDDNAFMDLDTVISMIRGGGGIPCYPLLLDDKKGNYTEFEQDAEKLYRELTARQIGCIELIPGRNDIGHLEKLVGYFTQQGFVVILGTEHNTPDLIPLTCDTRGGKPLSAMLRKASYEGACVVAAHQYLRAKGKSGFIDADGSPRLRERASLAELGNAVIYYTNAHLKS